MEIGFQRAKLSGSGGGTSITYPQAEVRFGLPGRNEFILIPPSYVHQRTYDAPDSPAGEAGGLSAATLGFKHELGYTPKWLGAVEALFTLPTGSAVFGSRGLGVSLNGVVAYTLTEQIGLTFQIGVSSQTDTPSAGGGRFNSLLSNFVVSWQPVDRLQFFGEVYGQSKTGPGKGVGCNADGGIQFLITPSWEVDLGGGVRLSGDLGGLRRYIGAGMGFRF